MSKNKECWCDPELEGVNPSCPTHGDASGSVYRVSGYALISVNVAIEVFAKSESMARDKALKVFKGAGDKGKFIVPGTDDPASAHDWHPTCADKQKQNEQAMRSPDESPTN